jgi:very-short-patch-repair endonuclease
MKIKIEIKKEWLLENGKYKCPYCNKECSKMGIKNHIFVNHTDDGKEFIKQVGEKISKSLSGKKNPQFNKKRTQKERQKISDGMKKAHAEGRAWNIGKNHWDSKSSYPEQFFEKVIQNEFEDKNYTREYPFFQYRLDFAWINKKLVIEIDGQQHEKKEHKKSDIKKDKLLKENDWLVLRIKWIDIFNNTQYWINIAKNFIHEDYLKYIYNNFYNIYESYNKEIDFDFLKEYFKNKKNKNKEIKANLKKQTLKNKIEKESIIKIKKDNILNSNIDFSKFGWVNKASEILEIRSQKVNQWMKINMPEFYETKCFKRKQNI